MNKFILTLSILLGLMTQAHAEESADWPLPSEPALNHPGSHLSRSMALITESSPEKRNTVRVLFYGQSITAQWSWAMEQYFRKHYPDVNFVFAHRAIGGFSADYLQRTAPTDINSFYPDLMLFHDYTPGPEPYEAIIRQTLENTTTDILITNDHLTGGRELMDESAQMESGYFAKILRHNRDFLPDLAERYEIELADIRGPWKQYLLKHDMEPKGLLKDTVHLNKQGVFLATKLIQNYLHYQPDYANPDEWNQKVRTHKVGEDLMWKRDRLELEFEGNRVDLIAAGSSKGSGIEVYIDGFKPSELLGTTVFTRASSYPNTWWPAVLRVTSETTPMVEKWSLRIFDYNEELTDFKFEVTGSVTGVDGIGSSQERFVSDSGRVVIEAHDWSKLARARSMSKQAPSEDFRITWEAIPKYVDVYQPTRASDVNTEASVVVAQGFERAKHKLTLVARDQASLQSLAAVRIYNPRLPN